MLDKWYKKEKPVFTGIARGIGGFGFGSLTGGNQIFPEEEYYFTGTNYDQPDNTGTITVPGSCRTIKVSGTGTGGCGRAAPGVCPTSRGGGGAASDIRGWAINGSPLQGVTLEYRVGHDSYNITNGSPTYLRVQGPGVMVVEYAGGQAGSTGPGQGGPNNGGGPNCVAGVNGAANAGRFNDGTAASPGDISCRGGGGGGAYTDNMQPGRAGAEGGTNNAGPAAGSVMTSLPEIGPAPDTWSWGTGNYAGGAGVAGSPGGDGITNSAGGDKTFAHGGASTRSSPGAGSGGGGGAGAGQWFQDPAASEHTGFYGGGGGGQGASGSPPYLPSHPLDGRGGRGILIVQFLNT